MISHHFCKLGPGAYHVPWRVSKSYARCAANRMQPWCGLVAYSRTCSCFGLMIGCLRMPAPSSPICCAVSMQFIWLRRELFGIGFVSL